METMRPARFVVVVLTALALIGSVLLSPVPAEAKPKTRTLKVLVVPVHFGSRLDTTASARRLIQEQTGGWLRTVSRQRVALRSTVTPVMRVKSGCGTVTAKAKAAATKRGYRLSRYDLVIVLAPTCSRWATSEHALKSPLRKPMELTLYGRAGRSLAVTTRQFGFLLGQDDSAGYLDCTVEGRLVTVAADRYCRTPWLGEDIDPMGSGTLTGSYSAPVLDEFGWLTKAQLVTRTRGTATVRLAPLLGVGVRVIKVEVKGATYWVEYRTRTGVDAQLRPELAGVRIWRSTDAHDLLYRLRQHFLLDMIPGGRWLDPLRPGSTWTSPEGVAIRVNATSAQAASVTVRFKAPKPKAPSAPRVSAVSGDAVVEASWGAAPDRGRPVTRYEVQARDPKGKVVWSSLTYAGDLRRMTVGGINGVLLTVRVRAVNDLGASPWGTARATPMEQRPEARIVSPSASTVVAGRFVDVVIEAQPHPVSKAPIRSVVVGPKWHGSFAAERRADGFWVARVDLGAAPDDGIVVLDAIVDDDGGRTAHATVPIEVPTRLAEPVLVAPVEDPAVWPSDTSLTVRVQPGLDRLTGQPAGWVQVDVGWERQWADSGNDWTVSFDRSAVRSEGGTIANPRITIVSSQSGLTDSAPVVREIELR